MGCNLIRKIPARVIAATAITLAVATIDVNPAKAIVLTFDDISTTISSTQIPDGYGGFDWNQFWAINSNFRPGTGYDNGTVSGEYAAFNAFAAVASASKDPFSFEGAYLTAAWNIGLNIQVEGFLDGNLNYSETIVVDPDEPTWFDFNFDNIDFLELTSFGGVNAGLGGGGAHFVMDDFTYKPVPEPGSLLGLLALSALGAGSIFKRKK